MSWIEHPQRYFQRVWRDSHVGCVIIKHSGEIVDANLHFASTLLCTVSEIIGKHVDQVTEYKFRGTGLSELRRVIEGSLPYYEQRKQYLRKDGKPVWATVRSFPIVEQKKLLHWFSIVIFESDVLADGQDLDHITQELDRHSRLIEAIVGKGEKTTHIHGSGNATDGGSINDMKIILFVGIAICIVAVSLAVLAFGGAFRATGGSGQSIEVQSKRLGQPPHNERVKK